MTRDAWIRAFVDELERLRPHLRSAFGTNRVVLALAAQAYDETVRPAAAARAVHQRMGPPPKAPR
jgi:hypothetical protein